MVRVFKNLAVAVCVAIGLSAGIASPASAALDHVYWTNFSIQRREVSVGTGIAAVMRARPGATSEIVRSPLGCTVVG